MTIIFEKLQIFTVMFGDTHIEGHSLTELDEVNSDVKYNPTALLFPPYSNLLIEEFQEREITDDLFAVAVIDVDGIHRSKRNMDYKEAVDFIEKANPMGDDYVSVYPMDSAVPYAEYYKDFEPDADRGPEEEAEL